MKGKDSVWISVRNVYAKSSVSQIAAHSLRSPRTARGKKIESTPMCGEKEEEDLATISTSEYIAAIPCNVVINVLSVVGDINPILELSGFRVQCSADETTICSDPSHPLSVQNFALEAAISRLFQSKARRRRSVMTAYRQRIDVGL